MVFGILVVDYITADDPALDFGLESRPSVSSDSSTVMTISSPVLGDYNVSGGLGLGGATYEATTFHFSSDTYVESTCICMSGTSPDIGTNVFEIGFGETDYPNATSTAEGLSLSTNVGIGPLGFGHSTAAVPQQENLQSPYPWLLAESPSLFTPSPPGTTLNTFSVGASIAPISAARSGCSCSVGEQGNFDEISNPFMRFGIEVIDIFQ